MKTRTHDRHARVLALTFAALFFFCGVAFIPHLGVQNDEALFASPLFRPTDWLYRIRVFHSDIPLLLMSYLGTLKTWLYKPILRGFGVSATTVRLPVLLAGTASIWLFYKLLRRVAGERPAWIGCSLLAADSLYLLTTCFDWGPVALQHLLTIAGLLLVVMAWQESSRRLLFAGFLLFGLAVWDKALAFWMLSGIGIAGFLTVPRQIFATGAARRGVVALLGFCLGASPFLIYNFSHNFNSIRENAARDYGAIGGRASLLENTVNGQGLFAWMFEEDYDTPIPHPPTTPVERISAGISTLAGHPRHSLMFYGLLLAVLLAPLARGNNLRVILFAAIALAVAWIQMATTANAGGSVHHIILLWPLPAMLMAASFAAASSRLGRAGMPVAVAMTVLLAGSELLVTNEYYSVMARNGGTVPWTDAVYTLSEYMKSSSAKTVSCVDWGILDSLRLLNRGSIPLRWGGDESDADLASLLAEPGSLFLGHSPGREVYPGKTARITQRAAALGYRREVIGVIGDRFGRRNFEIFRFRSITRRDKSPDGAGF